MSGTVTSREDVSHFPKYLGYPKTLHRGDVGIVPYKKAETINFRFCLLNLRFLTVRFL